MRILHVLTYYWPHWTGLTKYAQRWAEGMAARGHEVSVLTSRHSADLPTYEEHEGVAIHRLPVAGRLSRGVLIPSFPGSARRLIRSHDIVHVHTPMLETWLVTALANRAGKPSIVTDHGDLTMPTGLFNQTVQHVVTGLMSRGFARSSLITTHSDDYAENSEFLRPFGDKVKAMLPPIEIPDPTPEGKRAWRERLGVGDSPVVGFAGRFVEEKGFDYLLQAVPLVAARRPDVRFAFAGERFVVYEGFYERWAALFEKMSDRVIPVGLLTDPQELADFYGMCDVFALPSRTDCFPSVQIEALMCGTPSVTSDIPGARVAIQRTRAGMLVKPGDPKSLADGLLKVLEDPGAFAPTRASIEAEFGIERSMAGYEAVLKSLVGTTRPV